jgi:hypothetical protein
MLGKDGYVHEDTKSKMKYRECFAVIHFEIFSHSWVTENAENCLITERLFASAEKLCYMKILPDLNAARHCSILVCRIIYFQITAFN